MPFQRTNKPLTQKKAAKKEKPVKIPKAIDLRVRLIAEQPKPDAEGRFLFYASFPTLGVPDFRIRAKTEKAARWTLESYLYNELDFNDEITADD